METSISVKFGASLIHPETIELDTSTYDMIAFFLPVADIYALDSHANLLPYKDPCPL